jgi:hypothetical protein
MGLTDFLGGCKLEKGHPMRGHYAKGTKDRNLGIQTGSGAISIEEWEISGT